MSVRRAARRRALLLASLLLAGCGDPSAPPFEVSSSTVVTVAEVTVDDLRDVAQASGVVVPASAADLTIYASETAEIAELPILEGEAVATGDVLVRFDIASLNQELAALQLDVIEAESRADRARSELDRQTSLYERGITARNTYDASRLEDSTSQSALAAAKARLETLQASSQARTAVGATFPGVVAAVWHAVGEMVRPDTTDPILRVIDPTRVQVAVQLPVPQLARVFAGQTAVVQAIAGMTSEEATVASKAQVVDPTAPTGDVRLNFVNPATLPLDTPVSVEILLERRAGALIVPSQAIARDDFGPYVMVAAPDGFAQRRDVQLGLVAGPRTQVTNGVLAGDRVILSGLDEVEDGTPITLSR